MGVFCNLEHPTGLAEHKPFYSQDSGKGVSENVMAVVTDHRNSRQNIFKLKVGVIQKIVSLWSFRLSSVQSTNIQTHVFR